MSESQVARKDLEGIPRISPAQAKQLVDDGQAVLADTRDRRYYEEAHATGAISIPFSEIRRTPKHLELPSVSDGHMIIFYCT
ncbi:MAG: rhodanese-like domain-containing protein [Actinomycetota bacterium]